MMKRFFCLLCLSAIGLLAGAQTRTYSDNASGTFVIGLDNYFYGESGTLDFEAGGKTFHASVSPDEVCVDSQRLETGGDVVIGIHDFTGNRQPEFVVARRGDGSLAISVYTLQGSSWRQIGSISGGDGAREARIFRQVISIRRGEVLCSWTCHDGKFDYKASDGSREP